MKRMSFCMFWKAWRHEFSVWEWRTLHWWGWSAWFLTTSESWTQAIHPTILLFWEVRITAVVTFWTERTCPGNFSLGQEIWLQNTIFSVKKKMNGWMRNYRRKVRRVSSLGKEYNKNKNIPCLKLSNLRWTSSPVLCPQLKWRKLIWKIENKEK